MNISPHRTRRFRRRKRIKSHAHKQINRHVRESISLGKPVNVKALRQRLGCSYESLYKLIGQAMADFDSRLEGNDNV